MNKICQSLDMNGKKCRKKATCKEQMHFDPEIYHGWAEINFCDECHKKLGINFGKKLRK